MSLSTQELLERELGTASEPIVEFDAQIGTTAVLVLPNNPNRYGFVAQNLSGNVIFLLFDVGVTTTRGIRIGANGFRSFTWREDLGSVGWSWHGVADSSSSQLLIVSQVGRG